MIYFCTFFDRHYLARGLALYRSIIRFHPQSKLCILSLDADSFNYLKSLNDPQLIVLDLSILESLYGSLIIARNNRSRVEYYYTCKSYLCDYIFKTYQDSDTVIYVDADMFFFSSLDEILPDIRSHSVTLTPHRFSIDSNKNEIGIYNAGWISFTRSNDGLECLDWWRNKCTEWCYEKIEEGKWGDQGYLNLIPDLFNNVFIINHPGANLGPWNIGNYNITINTNKKVLVDNRELIFFHFHGLVNLIGPLYSTGIAGYYVITSQVIWQNMYYKYIESITIEKSKLPEPGTFNNVSSNRKNSVKLLNITLPSWFVLLFRILRYLPQGIKMRSYRLFFTIKASRTFW